LTGLLSATSALAEDHKAEATKHAIAAAESGKKGDAAGVGEHAAAAKTHAEAAQARKSQPSCRGRHQEPERSDRTRQVWGMPMWPVKRPYAAATHLKAAEKSF